MPEKILIRRFETSYKDHWDNFLKDAKNATFIFRRDFMEYHKDKFDDHSLLIFQEEDLVALLPANIETDSHSQLIKILRL